MTSIISILSFPHTPAGTTPSLLTPVAGDVRLLGDPADYRGAVEYYDVILGWTGICADSSYSAAWMGSRAAQIVCTQLGFEGGTPFVQRYTNVA